MGPVLQFVQFSMLRLDDLVSVILKAFRNRFVPGEELLCVQENVTRPCKVLQVIQGQHPEDDLSYEIEMMDNDGNITGISIEQTNSLVRKKAPFTRALVKSFIRESVKDNASRITQTPLVVHDKLCEQFDITMKPPEELSKYFLRQEHGEEDENKETLQSLIHSMKSDLHLKKRPKKIEGESEVLKEKNQRKVEKEDENRVSKKQKRSGTESNDQENKKQKKMDTLQSGEENVISCKDDKDEIKAEPVVKILPIKYPIEDTLVQPSPSVPPLKERPPWSSDFVLPMDCIGPMLMTWNFCSLFGKVIRLSPFSLEEFEKALECTEMDTILLREMLHALIKVIMDDDDTILESIQEKRKQKVKVVIQSWKEDLADLLELKGFETVAMYSSAVRKGNYRNLEPSVKLAILAHLVECALNSTSVREQLDAYIEEKQAIASLKRREVLEESKKEREAQEMLKQQQIAGTTSEPASATEGEEDVEHKIEEPERSRNCNHVGASSEQQENTGTISVPTLADEGNKEEEGDEESHSDDEMSTKKPSLENLHSNGLPNGTHQNGVCQDAAASAAARSRQFALKLRAELKQAEEQEKEKRRLEEQKQQQELRKIKLEAIKERKLQEKRMIESQKRQEHLEREMEKRVIRTNPLGKDKYHNRYWFFPREGRIFIEDKDMVKWGYYSAKEELEALYGSLNTKGIRECALQRQLEKHYHRISDALQRRTREIAQRIALEDSSVRRSTRGRSAPQQVPETTYRNKYRSS
ncbi:hypothetical protein KP509_25G058800 [Ceratopteris richardii]|nr:hypothetical protein KP509_25G058800 [Ceratopteris richardii]